MVSTQRHQKFAHPAAGASSLEMNSLRAFLCVVKAGSFVAAGQQLGLTRSAVGKSVARLEEHLGVRLFHRTTRSLTLSTDGMLFYERCAQALEDLDEAAAAIKQDKPYPKGRLRLTLPEAYGRAHILPVVFAFRQRWPEVSLEICFSDSLKNLVEEGFDLAIRLGVRPQSDSTLIIRTLANYSSQIVASPDYLSAKGTPTQLAQMVSHDRLMYGTQQQPLDWQLTTGSGETFRMSGHDQLFLDSIEAIRDAAIAGMGIALLPEFMTRDAIALGRLVPLFTEFQTNQVTAYIIYPNRKHLAAKVRCFIDMLVEHAGSSD